MIKKHQYSEAATKLTQPRREEEEQQAQPKNAAVVSLGNCRFMASLFRRLSRGSKPGDGENNTEIHGNSTAPIIFAYSH